MLQLLGVVHNGGSTETVRRIASATRKPKPRKLGGRFKTIMHAVDRVARVTHSFPEKALAAITELLPTVGRAIRRIQIEPSSIRLSPRERLNVWRENKLPLIRSIIESDLNPVEGLVFERLPLWTKPIINLLASMQDVTAFFVTPPQIVHDEL